MFHIAFLSPTAECVVTDKHLDFRSQGNLCRKGEQKVPNPTPYSDQGWLGDQTRLFIQSDIENLLNLVENYLSY